MKIIFFHTPLDVGIPYNMLIWRAVFVASIVMDFFPPTLLVEYEKCNNNNYYYFCMILAFDFMFILFFNK